MNLRRDDLKRIARAPAKLNLFLELLGRRDDGFHELETLMVPIRLADSVSFLPVGLPADGTAGAIQLERSHLLAGSISKRDGADSDGLRQSCGSRTGAVAAAQWLRFGARVELVKRIPAAAGLGGGSSDAAAALRLANRGMGTYIGRTSGWLKWRPRSAATCRFSWQAARRFAAGAANESSDCRRLRRCIL